MLPLGMSPPPHDINTLSLPVLRQGNFFQDDVCSNMREAFHKAVEEILARKEHQHTLVECPGPADLLSRYRQYRRKHMTEDSQAVTVTKDDQFYKILLDVHEFLEGEVEVKGHRDGGLVVKGIVNKVDSSSTRPCTFQKLFHLPEVSIADVVSQMSHDGVLTITAPIKKEMDSNNIINIPIQIEGSDNTPNTHNLQRGQVQSPQHTLFIKANPSSIIRGFVDPTEEIKRPKNLLALAVPMSHQISLPEPNMCGLNDMIEKSIKDFNVVRKGMFFQDSFFESARQLFREAVKDVLKKFGRGSPEDDFLLHYRDLRTKDDRDDTQAVKISEDEDNYKIVLDAHDFSGGDVGVRVLSDSELLVVGTKDKVIEGTKSKTTFRRHFRLPGKAMIHDVESAMSADGILTMVIPRVKE